MQAWRHDIHRHPELAFEEHRTAEKVADLLTQFGLEVHTSVGNTGVVGLLKKGDSERALGLRADMDALKIQEQNSFEHRSLNAGKMHACGHDGHTAMLLGAAQYLAAEGEFDGTVVFIFQPAEEHGDGARAMIEDGLFERFPVDAVYSIHNFPSLAVGKFAVRAGSIMAAEDNFEITVNGTGCHAAMPHLGKDAIVIGAEIVTAMQSLVSRTMDPIDNGVVSFTEFVTNGNPLPDHGGTGSHRDDDGTHRQRHLCRARRELRIQLSAQFRTHDQYAGGGRHRGRDGAPGRRPGQRGGRQPPGHGLRGFRLHVTGPARRLPVAR
jgi:hippurate hydrolase